jgi:hypothetical protein
MVTPSVTRTRASFNPLSKSETIANKLLARAIVDDICTNVVNDPDHWRQRAIEEIALHLDVASRHSSTTASDVHGIVQALADIRHVNDFHNRAASMLAAWRRGQE